MLADEASRLKALRYDDGSGCGAPSVEAAFELSYRQLDADAARLFRLLSADPGPDVVDHRSRGAIGLVACPSSGSARAASQGALVEGATSGTSRWRMHDLLRSYARQLLDVDNGEGAGRERAA